MATKPKQRVRKSAIKKWEQTYTVPIPYFGLMQIERDTHSSNYGNTENDTQVQYWGSIEKVFEGIPIAVSVSIRGEIEYFDLGNTDSMYEDDIPKEEYYRRRSLSEDNSSGASVASYTGKVVIRDPSTDSDHSATYYNYITGTGRDYGGPQFGTFMSIEDAINHVGEVVEDFFPEVMEYVNQEKMASTKKSQKASKMAKGQAVKKNAVRKDYYDATETVGSIKRILQSALNDLEYYDDNMKIHMRTSTYGLSSPILETSSGFMELYDISIDEDDYDDEDDEDYEASTKKSKYAKLHKALNKIGGFTKEDDDEDEEVEIEVDVDDDDDSEEEEVVEVESNEDESEKGCKSAKAFRTSKRVKMKKGEDMPADADDFQNDNQKGSGNAGSELPEDADDQQDENDPGSGNAGKELPEDADEQEDQKQARARKMSSRNKNVRKFSVTPGGSPNQESFAQRYPQAPMTRQAIDRHFSAKSEKSFDEVAMLQERIDNLNKSKRNKTNNGVPQKLRRY